MTKKTPLMKRIMTLFKKTHEKSDDGSYPPELEKEYTVTKKTLGVGSFAVVKECVHKSTGQSYALKIILKKAIAGMSLFRSFSLHIAWHVSSLSLVL